MAKQTTTLKRTQAPTKALIPEKYQDFFYIGLLFVLVFVFFGSAIFGNGFNATDTLSSLSFETFLKDARASGKFPLWMPYIFSGMPSYASLLTTGDRLWDFVPELVFGFAGYFGKVFGSDIARLAFWYLFYGTGVYFLVRSKKMERHVAFFAALAAVFSTWVILWAMIGHNTKPVVFAFVPFLFLFLEKLRERFSILVAVLLLLSLHLMFEAGHLQMIFYAALAIGLYVVIELINRFVTKNEPLPFVRAVGILVVAGGLAFLMSADRYFSTMEYTPYSTRGSAPIVKTVQGHQDQSGGNDYEYATMWSFSPDEVKTFFIPNFYGFGQLDYSGNLSNGNTIKMRTYWGQKPFEDAAAYMGIFVLLLAFVGVIKNYKDVFVQFLAILAFFALLLSFGYTFPIIYDFFFYNIPYFNKFRAPSMVLVLVQFAVPILAAYGLTSIFQMTKSPSKTDKNILFGLLGFSGLFLLFGLLYSGIFESSYIDAVANSNLGKQLTGGYGAAATSEIAQFIFSEMISDWLTIATIAIIASVLIFLYAKSKLSPMMFFSALTVLLLVDLWRVGYRPMEIAETKASEETFKRTDVINFLQNDKSKFRIADFTYQSANIPAFFKLENVNGYHSAKLRVYQDMLDVADQGSTSQVTNPFLWNILNVKYIVTPQQLGGIQPVFQSQMNGAFVYLNTQAVPRVFFVDSIRTAKQMDILKHLKDGDFNPLTTAYLEAQPKESLAPKSADASARILNYENELIRVETNNTAQSLLVFSEIYYPAGWKAYIDGKELEIYKTNFALRSVVVPAGKHIIEMKFASPGFERGKLISTSLNVVVVILLALGIFMEYRRRKKNPIV